MSDQGRMAEILSEVSRQFRKGDEHTIHEVNGVEVHDVYFMDHTSTASPDLMMIDMWFINVGVKKDEAESHRAELIELIGRVCDLSRLRGGPSYIEIGGWLGSQDLALMLMAVGEVLGFWKVLLPTILAKNKEDADALAGAGFLFVDGYKTSQEEPVSTGN